MGQTMTMLNLLALGFRVLLAAVFFTAAVAKLRDRPGTLDALLAFGVPRRAVGPGGILLPASEFVAGLLLLWPSTYLVGAIWSLLLLAGFTAAIGLSLARGQTPECRCFGESSTKPISAATVIRNLSLVGGAALVAAAGPGDLRIVESWVSGDSTGRVSGLLAALFALSLAQGLSLVRLGQSASRLRQRVEELERGGGWLGLPLGAEAPDFLLPTTTGGVFGLSDLLREQKPVLLLFTDPSCGPCETLLPDISTWQHGLTNVLQVGLVSRGSLDQNVAKTEAHKLRNLMVQETDQVAEAYRSGGTPSGVIIDAQGRIDSPMAHGVEEIRELLNRLITAHAQGLWQDATGEGAPAGLAIGSEPPIDSAPSLDDGTDQDLQQLLSPPTLLVFWSPYCTYCHQILDALLEMERELPPDRQLVLATQGSKEDNRGMGFQSRMLLDDAFELGAAYGAGGTPSAVQIEAGRVTSRVEVGVGPVLALAKRFASSGQPQPVETPSFRTG